MTNTSLLTGMLFVSMAVGLAACGPIVPVSPTWKDDVRPLVLARCVRCHDTTPHADPSLPPLMAGLPPRMPASNFNHPPDVALTPTPPPGLFLLHATGPTFIRATGKARMPPPPAAALEDWQIETLEAWSSLPAR